MLRSDYQSGGPERDSEMRDELEKEVGATPADDHGQGVVENHRRRMKKTKGDEECRRGVRDTTRRSLVAAMSSH